MASMQFAQPWSVPPVPFSAAVRPKSLSVNTNTLSMWFSMSAENAASASASPPTSFP